MQRRAGNTAGLRQLSRKPATEFCGSPIASPGSTLFPESHVDGQKRQILESKTNLEGLSYILLFSLILQMGKLRLRGK